MYKPSDKTYFKGRSSNGQQLYLHEVIQFAKLKDAKPQTAKHFAMIGYACDEGVKRNNGRIGAADGPNAIRRELGKFANHTQSPITDFGNIICDDENMEVAQQELADAVQLLIHNRYTPILLGGGHDIAFGHLKGIYQATRHTDANSIGIINFDAHLDLRKPNPMGNSGTPFFEFANYIGKKDFQYTIIGFRQESNHKGLIETANELNTKIISLSDCSMSNLHSILSTLNKEIETVDHIYITIDLDGFSSAFAPGVSAPHPVGLQPHFVKEILKFLIRSKKIISLDIAEMNPTFDIDARTAKLGANLVYQYLLNNE